MCLQKYSIEITDYENNEDYNYTFKLPENFDKILRSNDYLFLGHSESLINFTHLFKLKHFYHSLAYQKA